MPKQAEVQVLLYRAQAMGTYRHAALLHMVLQITTKPKVSNTYLGEPSLPPVPSVGLAEPFGHFKLEP